MGYYRGFAVNLELDSSTKTLVADLREARARAMRGEETKRWGIHAVNGATDYYELFSTPTNYADVGKVVVATTTLPSTVFFSSPIESSSTDVVFERITGTAGASSLILIAEGKSLTTTISALGAIY